MACNYNDKDKDPAYSEFHNKVGIDRNQIQLEDSKKKTVEKIRSILVSQFNEEINVKDHEINKIERRIHQNKMLLDRLRAYVVASYYGSGEKLVPVAKALPARKRKKREKENEVESTIIPIKKLFEEKLVKEKDPFHLTLSSKDTSEVIENNVSKYKYNSEPVSTNRFYVEKKVIVGNVSKYLLAETRKENDKSTHKWMVYVRGPAHDADISSYIKSVWFFLHPSYIPNDVIQINSPPFQLTRRGWGEFPIRVQLHFRDIRNKRFDIIHNLKLDKTYTGLQTLGAETIVKLELHRHASDNNNEITSDFPIINQNVSTLESSSKQPVVTSCSANPTSLHNLATVPELKSSNNVISTVEPAHLLLAKNESVVLSSSLEKNKLTVGITDPDTISILHELVIDAPLFDSEKNLRLNYFSCESLQKYASWSFSKRRACEWQRAIFIKKLFIEYKTVYSKALNVPTTKQIMLWCRRYGHVPSEINLRVLDVNSVNHFCHYCGKLQAEGIQASKDCCRKLDQIEETNTKTSFTNYINALKEKEKSISNLEMQKNADSKNDCAFIDILTDTVDNTEHVSKKPDIEIASNIQLDWIYEAASMINIHLPFITIQGVKAPVLHIMLRTAMKSFASELLRTANFRATENNRTTLDPTLVTSKHIVEAVQIIPKFDFLTEANLGKEEQEIISLY